MSETTALAKKSEASPIVLEMAANYGLTPASFLNTIIKTVFPSDRESTPEQLAAFLVVAKEYNLNVMTKEIFAFPTKGGGIQAVLSVDGWLKIINNRPELDGIVCDELFDDKGNLTAIRTTIHRKDRKFPTVTTEYLSECYRDTEPWRKWKVRMLRHKSIIQCARVAFSFSSAIMDDDEYERLIEAQPQFEPKSPILQPQRLSAAAPTITVETALETAGKQSTVETAAPAPAASQPAKTIEQTISDDVDEMMAAGGQNPDADDPNEPPLQPPGYVTGKPDDLSKAREASPFAADAGEDVREQDKVEPKPPVKLEGDPLTKSQLGKLMAICKSVGLVTKTDDSKLNALLKEKFGIEGYASLTDKYFQEACKLCAGDTLKLK